MTSASNPVSLTTVHPGIGLPKVGTLIPNRIFVGGIGSNTTEDELRSFFSVYGPIKDVKIIYDKSGLSKGSYGFVTFEDQHTVDSIIKNEGESLIFKDRKLNIGYAVRKQHIFQKHELGSTLLVAHNSCSLGNGISLVQFCPHEHPVVTMGHQPQLCYPTALVVPTTLTNPHICAPAPQSKEQSGIPSGFAIQPNPTSALQCSTSQPISPLAYQIWQAGSVGTDGSLQSEGSSRCTQFTSPQQRWPNNMDAFKASLPSDLNYYQIVPPSSFRMPVSCYRSWNANLSAREPCHVVECPQSTTHRLTSPSTAFKLNNNGKLLASGQCWGGSDVGGCCRCKDVPVDHVPNRPEQSGKDANVYLCQQNECSKPSQPITQRNDTFLTQCPCCKLKLSQPNLLPIGSEKCKSIASGPANFPQYTSHDLIRTILHSGSCDVKSPFVRGRANSNHFETPACSEDTGDDSTVPNEQTDVHTNSNLTSVHTPNNDVVCTPPNSVNSYSFNRTALDSSTTFEADQVSQKMDPPNGHYQFNKGTLLDQVSMDTPMMYNSFRNSDLYSPRRLLGFNTVQQNSFDWPSGQADSKVATPLRTPTFAYGDISKQTQV